MKHLNLFSNFALLFVLLLLSTSGCGKKNPIDAQYIEGVATLDGKPIAGATLTFYPKTEGAETAAASTDEQGRFTVTSMNGLPETGAITGEYAITASLVDPTQFDGKESTGAEVYTELLPKMYQDKEKTPLSANIVRGKNTVKLELKSK